MAFCELGLTGTLALPDDDYIGFSMRITSLQGIEDPQAPPKNAVEDGAGDGNENKEAQGTYESPSSS